MKSLPILFSTEMVQAILAGRKTQTRRPVKYPDLGVELELSHRSISSCRYGQPGDLLWVKETFTVRDEVVKDGDGRVIHEYPVYIYKADKQPQVQEIIKWKPSIFMPKKASRITLEITDIRVERLLDISEEDAKAEGVQPGRVLGLGSIGNKTYREGFISKWGEIYDDKYGLNPWVWVIEFKRIEP